MFEKGPATEIICITCHPFRKNAFFLTSPAHVSACEFIPSLSQFSQLIDPKSISSGVRDTFLIACAKCNYNPRHTNDPDTIFKAVWAVTAGYLAHFVLRGRKIIICPHFGFRNTFIMELNGENVEKIRMSLLSRCICAAHSREM